MSAGSLSLSFRKLLSVLMTDRANLTWPRATGDPEPSRGLKGTGWNLHPLKLTTAPLALSCLSLYHQPVGWNARALVPKGPG